MKRTVIINSRMVLEERNNEGDLGRVALSDLTQTSLILALPLLSEQGEEIGPFTTSLRFTN